MRAGSAQMVSSGLECAHRPEWNLDDHVVPHLLVEGEHPGVVGVVAVDHGVQLEPLDARFPHPPHLAGLVLQVGVHRPEGHQHFVLDADQPVVGPRQMVQPLDDSQHHGLVDARRPHVFLDPIHGIDPHRRIAEGSHHILKHRRRNAVRPDMGVYINAHQIILLQYLSAQQSDKSRQ